MGNSRAGSRSLDEVTGDGNAQTASIKGYDASSHMPAKSAPWIAFMCNWAWIIGLSLAMIGPFALVAWLMA